MHETTRLFRPYASILGTPHATRTRARSLYTCAHVSALRSAPTPCCPCTTSYTPLLTSGCPLRFVTYHAPGVFVRFVYVCDLRPPPFVFASVIILLPSISKLIPSQKGIHLTLTNSIKLKTNPKQTPNHQTQFTKSAQ